MPLSILIAGGDEWPASALESILITEGYAVLRARSARETLLLVHHHPVAAVIAASTLPEEGGIELCRRLRAHPACGTRVPIVITVAGPVERTSRLQAHMAGAWQVWGEPLDVELLLRQLSVYVSVRPPSRRTPRPLASARGLAGPALRRGAPGSQRDAGTQEFSGTTPPPH